MTDTDAKIAQLKEATRAANEVLGDLNRANKQARDLLDKVIKTEVDEVVRTYVATGLDEFVVTVLKAKDDATEKIFKEFDELFKMLMGRTKEAERTGMPDIREMIEKVTEDGE